jgi:hypothetical protein
MKSVLFLFLFILAFHNSAYSQNNGTKITVKEGMMEAYDQAFDSLHPYLQKIIIIWDSMELEEQETPEYIKYHFVYVTRLHTDTLNLDSITLPDLSSIKIIAINGVPY